MSATALELADEYKDIALERWKSFTTSIGQRIGEQRRRIWPSSAPAPEVAGSDASPGAIEPPRKRKRRWTQEPPESADTQAGSSTSGTLGSNQAANESEARSFDVEGVKKYLSSLSTTPKPIRHISHNLAVSIRYGNRIDRNQSYHPPAGAVKLTGTIEVRSRQAYIPVVLTAWYDVREGKWDNISIDASSVKEHWVQRQPGVIRSRKPRETGADHKPDPSAAPANESDESKKDP